MYEISQDEANEQLSALLDRAIRGETVIITTHSAVSVRLVPVPRVKGKRKAGSAQGKFIVPTDFDAPLEDFTEYTR